MQQLSLSITPSHSMQRRAMAGSVTEMIIREGSAITPMQLLPLLFQCNQGQRWLLWLSPHAKMNKRWLQSLGLDQAPVVQLDSQAHNQMQLCLQAIEAGNSHLLVEWHGPLSSAQRQQLEHCARHSATEVVVIQRRSDHLAA
ncbi:hypothetical protein CHH28_17015 [Bacterioplanes sanyensis]|uniref:Cell division inhibitor SulA n=1 Tax=Bacterioplanes sanyensis TaxID=1249553 RepID=A0A222FPF5_9GAMM|nr:SulA-like leucine-rich domain-containing protein [Bacterioplanes sanyensis]ASP40271.1 hypothetical protein CHH28_17015 [Bacterioplanes sanyensis]